MLKIGQFIFLVCLAHLPAYPTLCCPKLPSSFIGELIHACLGKTMHSTKCCTTSSWGPPFLEGDSPLFSTIVQWVSFCFPLNPTPRRVASKRHAQLRSNRNPQIHCKMGQEGTPQLRGTPSCSGQMERAALLAYVVCAYYENSVSDKKD